MTPDAEQTSIRNFPNGFFSSGGAGAVPSGGDYRYFICFPSASHPARCRTVKHNSLEAHSACLLAKSDSARPDCRLCAAGYLALHPYANISHGNWPFLGTL